MKKIRKSTFETNSSSVHAIVINKSSLTIPEKIWFNFGEFGWENEILNNLSNKADYFYTALLSLYTGDELNYYLNLIETTLINAGLKSITFNNNFKEEKLGEDIIYNSFDGYIDHTEELPKWINDLFENNLLLDYLFGSESYIQTGNDNDGNASYHVSADYSFIKGN